MRNGKICWTDTDSRAPVGQRSAKRRELSKARSAAWKKDKKREDQREGWWTIVVREEVKSWWTCKSSRGF